MMRIINELGTADLLYTFNESGVDLEQQYDVIFNGYSSLRRFCGMEDDRTKVCLALSLDLALDPAAAGAAGRANRLALSQHWSLPGSQVKSD